MTERKLQVPLPQAPHPDTFADNHMTIMSADQTRLICYCPRNRCGAVLHIKAGLWAMYCPLTFVEFSNTLGERGIMLPQGDDYETWLRALALAHNIGDATPH